MSKVITFSRTFPKTHPSAGKETYFVEQIYNSLGIKIYDIPEVMSHLVNDFFIMGNEDDRPANISECISEAMESLSDFEKLTDDQLVNWLNTNYPDRPKDKKGTWHEKF